MKIALSASYFNCPPVAELLHSCDIVYTTNDYALKNFAHKDIRAMKQWEGSRKQEIQGERFEFMQLDPVIITSSELIKIFHNWVANTATDIDLIYWSQYFGTMDANKMRRIAKGCDFDENFPTEEDLS